MARIESYSPGSFCWLEMVTDDVPASGDFYRQVMGWRIGSGEFSVIALDGDPIGALYALPTERRAAGERGHWLPYVSTADADAAAARVRELGGAVVAGPFSVGEPGRSAIFRDPQGTSFAVWEPGTQPGAQRAGEPGTLCWLELASPRPDPVAAFYSELFVWGVERHDTADGVYGRWLNQGTPVAGLRVPRETPEAGEAGAGGWLPFFQVADCDRHVERAVKAGGAVVAPATDHPGYGRLAVLADPRGVRFAVLRFAG